MFEGKPAGSKKKHTQVLMRKNRSATVWGNDGCYRLRKEGSAKLVYNREIHDKYNPITAETSTCIEHGKEKSILSSLDLALKK